MVHDPASRLKYIPDLLGEIDPRKCSIAILEKATKKLKRVCAGQREEGSLKVQSVSCGYDKIQKVIK